MERLTWMLTRMLRDAARLLPPGRQEWAEAVQAERSSPLHRGGRR